MDILLRMIVVKLWLFASGGCCQRLVAVKRRGLEIGRLWDG